jgi:hypothetical protein
LFLIVHATDTVLLHAHSGAMQNEMSKMSHVSVRACRSTRLPRCHRAVTHTSYAPDDCAAALHRTSSWAYRLTETTPKRHAELIESKPSTSQARRIVINQKRSSGYGKT